MALYNICIRHIHVDYAGGRVTQGVGRNKTAQAWRGMAFPACRAAAPGNRRVKHPDRPSGFINQSIGGN